MKCNHQRFRLALAGVVIIILAAPRLASAQTTIATSALTQITDILVEKAQFTDTQRKIDSALVFAAKSLSGSLAGKSFLSALPNPGTDAAGFVTVDIGGAVPAVVSQVSALGGQVISQFPQYNAVRARIPLSNVEALAGNAAVRSVATAQKPFHNVGALTSQGYVSHAVRPVVNGMAITGAGVKVGVMSDSASLGSVQALIASGDLKPNATILPGQAGVGTDEGAAIMEIIQDIAPDAQVYFATADGGAAQMAANIAALAAAGCSIIVDDVFYLDEGAFQDGPIAQAVNTFVANGGMYFSSAGNSGNLDTGTSGTWEGDFVDGGSTASLPIPEAGRVHNFGSALYNTVTATFGFVGLKWSDPLGGSANDYDLFVLDSSGTKLKGFSSADQSGSQDPYELVFPGVNCGTPSASGYCPAPGDRAVAVLFSGVGRALRLETYGGRLSNGTTGAIFGHNAAANTVSVAATFWNSAKTGTKAFTGAANPVEYFSSDGPRRFFYNPNGTPITAGNFLFGTNGGTTVLKPDLTAADGASSKTPGFLPFFGTSASAPHAAAVAALVKSARPDYTAAQVRNALTATALDNMAPGFDRDGGYGVVMALPAVQYALSH